MSIQDVELRHIHRSVPAPEFGPNVGKTVAVLQSRKLMRVERRELVVKGDYSGYVGGSYDEWTEWQDVPTVDA